MAMFQLYEIRAFRAAIRPAFHRARKLFHMFVVNVTQAAFVRDRGSVHPSSPLSVRGLFQNGRVLKTISV